MSRRLLPQILLLQVRRDARALEHERACYLSACRDLGEFSFRNLPDEPAVRWADVRGFEVLMVGGSGECSATEEYPFSAPLGDVVRRWITEGRPFFGSCWGHQFLAVALGGRVVTDRYTSEVGTFAVELEAAGRRDPLLAQFPRRFQAQMGHHDYVSELAPGTDSLARSDRCPNQIVKVVGKPAYSTQFHSELGRRQLLERLRLYQDDYLPEGRSMEEMEAAIRPSPAVRPLLRRFLEMVT
ncbi:MAG: type 1 glutamine amidotransferase [Thermoanaerobaculia bacterium]|nr:type 1 glutamine amidotransferase [Thermoanaerobaculia bacterium]